MYAYENDANYCEMVELVIKVEGGYVNDPKDKGGPTKFGIAWNHNEGILRSMGFKKSTDIQNLTKEQALQIYYQKYWLVCGADVLAQKSRRLAYIHFDSCVNHGPGNAAKFYFRLKQSPKNFEGGGKNLLAWRDIFLDYSIVRARFFTDCETWPDHGRGWIRRLAAVMEMAGRFPY